MMKVSSRSSIGSLRLPLSLSSLCFLLLYNSHVPVSGDIVFENELIKPEEIFDFEYSTDSDVYWTNQNVSKYYCVFRSLWTKENQPEKYPVAARWGDQLIYSGTKQFFPWLKNRATTLGVEKAAESGFTDTLEAELIFAGEVVQDVQQNKGFVIDQEDWEKNYQYLPGVEFDADHNFLSGIAGLVPSPCWFTGFYLFDVIDEYDRVFWDRFRVKTYPWSSGTDGGQTYTSPDMDLDPPDNVHRMTERSAPNGIFFGPDGKVGPLAEWDCVLNVCPFEDPDCEPENWPPANYCDRLKYPGCEFQCDPDINDPCQECKKKEGDEGRVFYKSCCESNYEPKDDGECTYEPQQDSGGDGTWESHSTADSAAAPAPIGALGGSCVALVLVAMLASTVAWCSLW